MTRPKGIDGKLRIALAGLAACLAACGASAAAGADGAVPQGSAATVRRWRPSVRWYGFNLLGMFCQTKMEAGDTRICGWGWALWNIDGKFGIMDTQRTDCAVEDFHGHKLDRQALDLLVKFAKAGQGQRP